MPLTKSAAWQKGQNRVGSVCLGIEKGMDIMHGLRGVARGGAKGALFPSTQTYTGKDRTFNETNASKVDQ